MRGRIADLDALRGIAIALVVTFHAHNIVTVLPGDAPVKAGWLDAFLLSGHTGVTLFFVLSGFLLAPPFITEALGGPGVARGAFFVRRARRILPLYYLFVVLAGIAFASEPRGYFTAALPYFFFLNSFPGLSVEMGAWSLPWWSLATEVQYYLLLPLLPLLWRRVPASVLLLLVVAWLGLYTAVAGGWIGISPRTRVVFFTSLLGRGFAFVGGAVAALLVPSLRARMARVRSPHFAAAASSLALLTMVAGLSLLLQHVAALGYLTAELTSNWWHVVEAALWSAVVLLVVATPVWGKGLLCSGGPVAIGRWSYSLYLIHLPLLWNALNSPRSRLFVAASALKLSRPALVWLGVGLCVPLSALSYRFIERPFLAPRSPG
jgi:peptidoglycan/LPS O-acetylase OafA/YrhL